MSFIGAGRSVERQRFFDGQRLFAPDLQEIEGFNREMRWLHNRSLHQPGIGNGFAVSGAKKDREVKVGPGYAIDDLGQEIVLTGPRTIPVQPVAGDVDGTAKRFVLTVQYPDDADLEEVELRQGVCDTRGAVRLREEPVFCWVPLTPDGKLGQDRPEILAGRKIVLAEVAVKDCKLDKDVSIAQRRNARPPAQPYIAGGNDEQPNWEPRNPFRDDEETLEGAGRQILANLFQVLGGFEAHIDTSEAGFLTTPNYFARIDGDRAFRSGKSHFVVDGLVSIVHPTSAGFIARVIVLDFDARRQTIEGTGTSGLDFLAGFGASALASTRHFFGEATGAKVSRAPEGARTHAAATPKPNLNDVLKAWQVGWMGVEG